MLNLLIIDFGTVAYSMYIVSMGYQTHLCLQPCSFVRRIVSSRGGGHNLNCLFRSNRGPAAPPLRWPPLQEKIAYYSVGNATMGDSLSLGTFALVFQQS